MTRLARLVLPAACAAAGLWAAPASEAAPVVPGVVEVRNNFFDPQTVRVEAGGTVRWTVVDGGHTVTADDGRFDFPATGTLAAGESVSWTAGPGEVLRYHCKLHGGEGMVGSIVVGDGGAPPPPAPSSVLRVPAEYPTVASAVAAAREGSVVKVAAGVYDEAVEVDIPGITIEGEGADAVLFDGRYRYGAAITGRAQGLVVRGVAARRYLDAAFLLEGPGALIERVAAFGNEGAGVRASGPGTVVRDSRFADNAIGIHLTGGTGFDVLANTVTGGAAVRPGAGVWVDGAWGARVTANAVQATRLGVVVTAGARQVDVVANRVSGSASADLAYDGLGIDVCFGDNGPSPRTEPPVLLTASSCDKPHAFGVPDPLVHVLLRS